MSIRYPHACRPSDAVCFVFYAVAMETPCLQFLLVAEAALEASSGQGPGGFGTSDGGTEEYEPDVV